MTKMAATPIYGKNPLKIFSETSGLISIKPGVYHWRTQALHSLHNDDLGLTITYFTAKSNFVTKAFLKEKVSIVHFIY